MSMVDISKLGKKKKYGGRLLGMVAWECGEYITVLADKLIDFGDVQYPIVGCIKFFSKRKHGHYRLVALMSSNRYLSMPLIKKSLSLGTP